jgi:hypothetical protein
MKGRREKSCKVYFYIGFPPMIHPQQVHPFSPLKATWSPNFNEFFKHVDHLIQTTKVEFQNSN